LAKLLRRGKSDTLCMDTFAYLYRPDSRRYHMVSDSDYRFSFSLWSLVEKLL
jgi:hypothetical protein